MRAPIERAGSKGKCPDCLSPIVVPRPVFQAVERPSAQPSSSAPREPVSNRTLPERMRANRTIAGRICPQCHTEIELGDPIVNCRDCDVSSHEHCYERVGSCPNVECRSHSNPPPTPASGTQQIAQTAPELSGPTISCPYCGEAIMATAKKCKYCQEWLDEFLRKINERMGKNEDDNMTAVDVLLCVFCSGIGCVMGLIYAIQGKKKGWKMMVLSIVISFLFSLLRAIMEES